VGGWRHFSHERTHARGDGTINTRLTPGAVSGCGIARRGWSYHVVVGDTLPPRCLDFARAEHATRLLPGDGRRSRPAQLPTDRAPALPPPA
jgi:hypothetical protein